MFAGAYGLYGACKDGHLEYRIYKDSNSLESGLKSFESDGIRIRNMRILSDTLSARFALLRNIVFQSG